MYNKLICFVLVLVLSLGNISVMADTNVANKDQLINISIENSSEVLELINNNVILRNEYFDVTNQAEEIDHYIDLYTQKNLSYQKKMELEILKMIYGDYANPDNRSNLMITRFITPLNIKYSLENNLNMQNTIKNNIEYNISLLLINAEKLYDAIEIQKGLLSRLEYSVKNLNSKYQIGKVSIYELKQLENKRAQAKVELNKLTLKQNINQVQLYKITGQKNISQLKSGFEGSKKILELEPVAYYIEKALSNRADIKLLEEYYNVKKQEYEIYKTCYNAEAHDKVRSASFTMNNAKYSWDMKLIDVEKEISNLYTEFQNKSNSLQKSEQLYEINMNRYVDAKKRYSLGQISELDLINTESNYANSRINLINAKRDIYLLSIRINQSCGVNIYLSKEKI